MNSVVLHIDIEKTWRGGQQQAVYLYESLINKSIKSNFVCRKNSEIEHHLKEKNLKLISFNISNPVLSIISAKKIADIARKEGFNILHCHSSASLSLGLLVKLFFKKIKLIGVRRVDFPIKSKMKYNSSMINKIICISDAIKVVMTESGINKEKLITIHSGIKTDKFKNADSKNILEEYNIKNQFIVGTVAAFTGHKDYHNLIRAAKIIINSYKNIYFMAVGSGKLFNEIRELAIKEKISENFIFTGFRANPGDIIKAFDIFVMSSKKEGLGTSILDAMALGKPIVASRTGGIPEAVRNNHNGILVEKQNPFALADAIIELYHDKAKRLIYGNNSIDIVKNFDIDITVKKNIRLYKELLNA